MPAQFPNNFWMDFLEERPDIGFASHLQEKGYGRHKTDTLRGMFGKIQQNFFGQLGSQVRGGNAPTLRFNDFLKNLDFDKYYRGLSPNQKGMNRNSNAPGVRRIVGY